MEFGSQVRRDPALLKEFAERGNAIRTLIANLVTVGASEMGTRLPMPADRIAAALLSLGVGLGLQRAIDPSVSVSVLTDTIRVFAGAAIPTR